MYCIFCGAEMNEGASFCPNCGAQLNETERETRALIPAAETDPRGEGATAILVLGIVAAAVCEWGIPGIILGAIGRKKAKAFLARHGEIKGRALVGSILSKVGIIVGIIMTVIWTLYILLFIAAIIVAVVAGINTHFWYGV